jgi:hypothetical protein
MKWTAEGTMKSDGIHSCAIFRSDSHCTVLVGREPLGPNGELRWHLSISHRLRYPTWDEIADARYRFIPDEVTVVMFLPPRREYVNLHPNCFHLHEIVELPSAMIRP